MWKVIHQLAFRAPGFAPHGTAKPRFACHGLYGKLEPRQIRPCRGSLSFRGIAQMLSRCRAISSYWFTQIR